jgi:hypothetical protein
MINVANVQTNTANVQCIAGYVWNGIGCIYLGAGSSTTNVPGIQICNINYVWDGSKCILSGSACSSGYIWTGINCIPSQVQTQVQTQPIINYQTIQQQQFPIVQQYPTYPIQQQTQQQIITTSTADICAPGYTYANGVCTINTASTTPLYQCAAGYTWNGVACTLSNPGSISTIPSCPNGYIWTGQTCMPFSGSNNMNCAGGYVWNYPSSSCIAYNQYTHGYGNINCISGTYWNGAGCIQYPSNSGCSGYGCGNNDDSSTIIIIIKGTNNSNNKKNNYCLNGWVWNGYCCVDSGQYDCNAG